MKVIKEYAALFGILVYLLTTAYSAGTFSNRLSFVEAEVHEMKQDVKDLTAVVYKHEESNHGR